MIFIDGFGLGSVDPSQNPFAVAEMPFIRGLLGGECMSQIRIGAGIFSNSLVIKPTDAGLDVTGIPQSATGQTALFTGVNAAKIAGRHINGFPTKQLREVLQRDNLFKAVNRSGSRAVFANIFTKEYFQAVEQGKWRHSVTTTAALAGGCHFLLIEDLLHGKGVFQDITNEQLRERGYDVPVLEPETAAQNLIRQASQNDFTLFEYFQTDHCGHERNWELALVLLNRLDRFLHTIAAQLAEYNLDLLVVSDHGNIEDLSIKTHTTNLVPTIAIGKGAARFAQVSSLPDIYPKVLEYLGVEAGLMYDYFQ
jgi:2,3-bisphosphoglycerate-independent phosphoglycerate mutase